MANAVDRAKSLMKQRRFSRAISLLEARSEFYIDDFDYYVTLGKACLYVGDFGTAASYYSRARGIKINNSELLLGQAAIFLHRGDTERAVEYYLNILETEPGNSTAKNALEFIRLYGHDYSTICKWADSGKLEKFYPPLGINPLIIVRSALLGIAVALIAAVLIVKVPYKNKYIQGPREDISSLNLTEAERASPKALEQSGTKILSFLTNEQIEQGYQKAQEYFQSYKDNSAQIEVNRLLASDVSLSIRSKLNILSEKLNRETDFMTLEQSSQNIEYQTVINGSHYLYENCVISWRGRASLVQGLASSSGERYVFNIGYEDLQRILGQVDIVFNNPIQPPLDVTKPVEFLAKIHFTPDDVLYLEGLHYHQPQDGKFKN